jgi:hypothetical protein
MVNHPCINTDIARMRIKAHPLFTQYYTTIEDSRAIDGDALHKSADAGFAPCIPACVRRASDLSSSSSSCDVFEGNTDRKTKSMASTVHVYAFIHGCNHWSSLRIAETIDPTICSSTTASIITHDTQHVRSSDHPGRKTFSGMNLWYDNAVQYKIIFKP